MGDPNELAALQAAFGGALAAGEPLAGMRERIEALDPHGEVDAALLEELARIAGAHAVASAALRGLVETMIARRPRGASA